MYSERVILGQEIVKYSLTVSLECGSLWYLGPFPALAHDCQEDCLLI